MGHETITAWVCDQCGKREEAQGGMAPNPPASWVQVAGTLWFHSWACVRRYAAAQVAEAAEDAGEAE